MDVRISRRRMSIVQATPAAPSAARPQSAVRPTATALAPHASPLITSVPRAKPPSTMMLAAPATVSATAGSASMLAWVASS